MTGQEIYRGEADLRGADGEHIATVDGVVRTYDEPDAPGWDFRPSDDDLPEQALFAVRLVLPDGSEGEGAFGKEPGVFTGAGDPPRP